MTEQADMQAARDEMIEKARGWLIERHGAEIRSNTTFLAQEVADFALKMVAERDSKVSGIRWDGIKRSKKSGRRTELTTALEKVKQYEEMCGMIDMADLTNGNELWQLSGQWMHGNGPKVYNTILEAFDALKQTEDE